MRIHHMQVSLSTSDKAELANFYAHLLHTDMVWEDPPASGETDGNAYSDVATDSGEFRINFEHDEEWQPPVWPSERGKNNMTQHICIFVYDLNEAVEHAQACGATLDPHQFEDIIRVMRDPHGHPFCLILAEEAQ